MEIPGYKIVGTVGQGGMALVYEAIQNSLHRKVALKVLSPALVADPEFCQRFLEEGKTVARLSHPNIVTIYDIGHHENHYFMSMEFIEGGNLRSRIEAGMSEAEVVRVARQVARALGYAHDHGFLHRDVKPHNVLFREDGAAVLSDFGIAKNLSESSELTRTGKSLGSPLYMSPEQIRNEPLDVRSDLYSLGVVIYQMLTGYAPYLATTADSTTRMHLTCPLPKLPKAQEKFQPIIRRLLAKSRNNRFLNAWELIEALDSIPLGDGSAQSKAAALEHTTVLNSPASALSPGSTQELGEDERLRALQHTAASLIAERDEDGASKPLTATREQQAVTATLTQMANRQGVFRLVFGGLLLVTLVGLGLLFYPRWVAYQQRQVADVPIAQSKNRERSEPPVEVSFESAPNAAGKPVSLAQASGAVVAEPPQSGSPEASTAASAAPTGVEPESAGPVESAEVEEGPATLASLAEAGDSKPASNPGATDSSTSQSTAGRTGAATGSEVAIQPAPPLAFGQPASEPAAPVADSVAKPEPPAPKPEKLPAPAEFALAPQATEEPVFAPDAVAEEEVHAPQPVPFESLRDPGLSKVNGEYWISHELENILRQSGDRVLRLGDGSLLVSAPQNDLFLPDSDHFAAGATDRLDRLAYVFRNYSGFNIQIGSSRGEFNADAVLDMNVLRAQRVRDYLKAQMNDPRRLKTGPVTDNASIEGGSIDFHLVPIPVR